MPAYSADILVEQLRHLRLREPDRPVFKNDLDFLGVVCLKNNYFLIHKCWFLVVYEKWLPNGRHEALSFDNHSTRAAKVRIFFQTETEIPIKNLFLHNLLLERLAVVECDLHNVHPRREAADVDAPEAGLLCFHEAAGDVEEADVFNLYVW